MQHVVALGHVDDVLAVQGVVGRTSAGGSFLHAGNAFVMNTQKRQNFWQVPPLFNRNLHLRNYIHQIDNI